MEEIAKKSAETEGGIAYEGVDVESQLNGANNLPKGEPQAANVLNYVYALLGLFAVVVIIYNAVQYLTAGGDPSKTKKATQGLVYAAVGLVVVLLATVITNLVFSTVGGAS